MDLLSVSDTQPNPTNLSPQQVGLDALPSFEPTQQEAIQLAFVDDEDLLPRSDAVNAFLLNELHDSIVGWATKSRTERLVAAR